MEQQSHSQNKNESTESNLVELMRLLDDEEDEEDGLYFPFTSEFYAELSMCRPYIDQTTGKQRYLCTFEYNIFGKTETVDIVSEIFPEKEYICQMGDILRNHFQTSCVPKQKNLITSRSSFSIWEWIQGVKTKYFGNPET